MELECGSRAVPKPVLDHGAMSTSDGPHAEAAGRSGADPEPTLRHASRRPQRRDSRTGRSGRRRPPPAGIAAAALAVVVLAAFLVTFLSTSGSGTQTTSKAKGLLASIAGTVAVGQVESAPMTSQLTLTGTVGSVEGPVSITPQATGTVLSLSVAAGQNVAAGQAVAQLSDIQGVQAKQAAAQAQLAQAQAALADAQSPTSQPATVAQAQDQVASAQAALADAQAKQTADEKASASAEQLSEDAAAVTEAQSQLTAAQQALSAAENPAGASPGVIQGDQAAVSAAQDNLTAANQAVTQLTVTSPVAGAVAQILVPVGGYASPTTPIATLAGDTETLTAQASPMATAMLAGKVGAVATAALAIPGAMSAVTATLSSVAPSADPTTQQTAVSFVTGAALQSNAPVTITVDLPQPSSPAVPSDAVVTDGAQQGIYVVTGILNPTALGVKLPSSVPKGTELGTATFTPVTTGASVNGTTQIISRATSGETIVVTGQTTLSSRSGPQKVAILASATSTTKKPSAKGSAKPKKKSKGSTKPKKKAAIKVTIVSLHGTKVTVSTPIGKKAFTIPHGLTITKDGKPVPIDELHAGDVIDITLGKKDGKHTITSAKLQ